MPAGASVEEDVRMRRALPLPLLAMLGGCSLREPRVTVASCATNVQCSNDDICFLGECRPASAASLSVVPVEVRPPSGSSLGVRSVQLDLGKSLVNDVTLTAVLTIGDTTTPGSVMQGQDGGAPVPVAGAIVTFSDDAPVIPDRVEQVASTTDGDGGYRASVPQGTWDVLVQPPSPLPPLRLGVLDTAAPVATYLIPSTDSLPQLDGGVTANGAPLGGVSITAVDDGGSALSSAVITQSDGTYSIYLPPDAASPPLQIGPPAAADGGAAGTDPLDPFPTYAPRPWAPAIALTLPPVATLSGSVTDSTGSPVPAARVYVRSTGVDWTLSRSVVTDATGAYGVTLRQGDYMVEAVPGADASSPALSAVQSLTVSASTMRADLVCPPKVRRRGVVVGPDGRPVAANFQIVATRLADALVTTRTASTTPTDSTGVYHVVADGGRWRFEVVPPSSALLPHTIVQFDLDPADLGESLLPTIQISPPLRVGGTVGGAVPGAPETPVLGAQVSFFALDASGHSVLLGRGMTDSLGHYDVILPDVAQPAP